MEMSQRVLEVVIGIRIGCNLHSSDGTDDVWEVKFSTQGVLYTQSVEWVTYYRIICINFEGNSHNKYAMHLS